MKQNLPAAKTSASRAALLFISISIINAACLTLPAPETVTVQAPVAAAIKANRLNVNTASASELQSLPGIGATMAARIVAYREFNGPFRRIEHLMMVRGISDRKFRELQSLIAID